MDDVLDCCCDCEVEITDYSDLDEETQVILVTGIELIGQLPQGGEPGQVLVKASDKDYDAEWRVLTLSLVNNDAMYTRTQIINVIQPGNTPGTFILFGNYTHIFRLDKITLNNALNEGDSITVTLYNEDGDSVMFSSTEENLDLTVANAEFIIDRDTYIENGDGYVINVNSAAQDISFSVTIQYN